MKGHFEFCGPVNALKTGKDHMVNSIYLLLMKVYCVLLL